MYLKGLHLINSKLNVAELSLGG